MMRYRRSYRRPHKSRFVEMFGDPMTNPNGWPMAMVGDHLRFLTSGSRG